MAVGLGGNVEPPEDWGPNLEKNEALHGVDLAIKMSRVGRPDEHYADRERGPAEGKQAGLWDWIAGGPSGPPEARNPPTVTLQSDPDLHWPGAEDVAKSKEVDQTYGDPVAPYTRPGGATQRHISITDLASQLKAGKQISESTGRPKPITEEDAMRIHQSWLAAERSPVSKLGFSPGRTIESFDEHARLSVAGLYQAKPDMMWYDSTYPAAIVHESIHRGIETLRKAGKLPADLEDRNEELITRALMLRHFGDREARESGLTVFSHYQIKAAMELSNDPKYRDALNELERIAAEHVAEKRPRGPR